VSCIECLVRGRVQGVFFRDSTRQLARQLGLRGSAANLADGSVRVVACGDQRSLEALQRFLAAGPPRAHVEELSCKALQCDPPPDFRIG
jgi:acylphosphatase